MDDALAGAQRNQLRARRAWPRDLKARGLTEFNERMEGIGLDRRADGIAVIGDREFERDVMVPHRPSLDRIVENIDVRELPHALVMKNLDGLAQRIELPFLADEGKRGLFSLRAIRP